MGVAWRSRLRAPPWAGSCRLAGVLWLAARLLVPGRSPSSLSALPGQLAASVRVPSPQRPCGHRARGGQSHARVATLALAAVGPISAPLAVPRMVWLVLFVLTDVGQALAMDWAENRPWKKDHSGQRQYVRQTVPVVASSVSILTSLTWAATSGGADAVLRCFDPGRFLRFLPVSLCLAVGLSVKMMAVNHFQAGTIKIFGQLRLPMVALLSTLLLAARYSVIKWQVIAMITTSCTCFVWLKGQRRVSEGKSVKWSGFCQLFAWVLLNVVGGLVAEVQYKSETADFYAQKVSEDFGHFLAGVALLLVFVPRFKKDEDVLDQERRPGGFFDSWDARTVVVVAFLIVDAWISNKLLKEFSSLTRSVAKAFAIAVVYVTSLVYAKDRRNNFALSLVAMLVIQSSLLFSFVR